MCGKGVQANSVQCTVCQNLIHRRCSFVRGDLSRVADGCCMPFSTIHVVNPGSLGLESSVLVSS